MRRSTSLPVYRPPRSSSPQSTAVPDTPAPLRQLTRSPGSVGAVERGYEAPYSGPTMSDKPQHCRLGRGSMSCAPSSGLRQNDFAMVALHRLLTLASDHESSRPCELLTGPAWGFTPRLAASLWRHLARLTPPGASLLDATEWSGLIKQSTKDGSHLEELRDLWNRHLSAVADVTAPIGSRPDVWTEEKLVQLAVTGYWHEPSDLGDTFTAIVRLREAKLSELVVEALVAHLELLVSTQTASKRKAAFAKAVSEAVAKLGKRRSRPALAGAVRLGTWSSVDDVVSAYGRVRTRLDQLKKVYDGKLAELMTDAAASASTSLAEFEATIANHEKLYSDLFSEEDEMLITALTRIWTGSQANEGRRGRPPAPPFEPLVALGEIEVSEGFWRKQRQRLRSRATELISHFAEQMPDHTPDSKARCILRIVDACVQAAEVERKVLPNGRRALESRLDWLRHSGHIVEAAEAAIRSVAPALENPGAPGELGLATLRLGRARRRIEVALDRVDEALATTQSGVSSIEPGGRQC